MPYSEEQLKKRILTIQRRIEDGLQTAKEIFGYAAIEFKIDLSVSRQRLGQINLEEAETECDKMCHLLNTIRKVIKEERKVRLHRSELNVLRRMKSLRNNIRQKRRKKEQLHDPTADVSLTADNSPSTQYDEASLF